MRNPTFAVIALAAAGAVATPGAQAAPIAVGAAVPASFAARDASGKLRNFASIKGRKGTVLVLFRSAKWCPYCQAQLKDLKGAQAALAQRGYTLNALSYDPPATLADFAAKQGIGYTLLSDERSATIDALGLRDPQYPKGTIPYGVPRASVLVIDGKGVVRSKMVAADYKFRPTTATILAAVDGVK